MQKLALFPLHTVLFPEARLPLRIFETRYLDMVRRCLRADSLFGICLIQSGNEVGAPARIFATGTAGRIVDWEQRDDGLLGISVAGEWRFRVHAQSVAKDNLLLGEVERLAEDPPTEIQSFSMLQDLLLRILTEHRLPYAREIHRIREAAWLSYRLAELLALPLPLKQQMLEAGSHAERLAMIQSALAGAGAAKSDGGISHGH
ncbi:MAG: LON peptidase substrate-binding domain-containing protein [Gammaproteobacteria bacterium]|nr:LON peptidase substrate-binding domain-containing protein [Gammaproteobacteria bacterium]